MFVILIGRLKDEDISRNNHKYKLHTWWLNSFDTHTHTHIQQSS